MVSNKDHFKNYNSPSLQHKFVSKRHSINENECELFFKQLKCFILFKIIYNQSAVEFQEDHKITPACIPDGTDTYENKDAWVTGYGTLFSGGPVSTEIRQGKFLK